MPRLTLVYQGLCPNCGGPIEEERLRAGLPCTRCLPKAPEPLPSDFILKVLSIGRELERRGALRGYWDLYDSTRRLLDFEGFFKTVMGGRPLWSAQRCWARRLLSGESFAIVAPTGVGKTTLLVVYAIYRAWREHAKIYYLVPTENLVVQVADKLAKVASRVGKGVKVVSYCSRTSTSRRRESLRAIEEKDYNVLVTTANFLSRRWDLLSGARFDFIAVDDVDAVLRNSKNVDRLLLLLGFTEDDVDAAYRLVVAKLEAARAKAQGNLERYERALNKVRELEALVSSSLSRAYPGQLVVASATGRAYGLKPKIFRELLGFEIGRVCDYVRSVSNLYEVTSDVVSRCVELAKSLVSRGSTGIVFVPKYLGREAAKSIAQRLEEEGVKAAVAISGRRALERFASGNVDALVGVATYYGVVVRGVDLPERVHFTVFAGAPVNKMPLAKALLSPRRLVAAALELGVEGGWQAAKMLTKLSPQEYTVLRIAMLNGEDLEGKLGRIVQTLKDLYSRTLEEVQAILSRRAKLKLSRALIVVENGIPTYITPDAATYLQASGRSSRMYGSTMTHGVSIVLEVQRELVELLAEKLKTYIGTVKFEPLEEVRLHKELEKAKRSRRFGGKSVDVETCLIVVESPTKAKTIASFFGRPARRRVGGLVVYETTFYNPVNGRVYVAQITATRGHIFDLTTDDVGVYGVVIEKGAFSPVYTTIKTCLSCGYQFASSESSCVRCGSRNIADKVGIVDGLRRLASEVDAVYIATDPDVEGEKIAYDILLSLNAYAGKIKRIELHEITREELFKALAAPRDVSKSVAYAQVVRRVEDRWIGFGLSRLLWTRLGLNWLGAGRVQTPVLGWILKRYDEWLESRGYVVRVVLPGNVKLKFFTRSRDDAFKVKEAIEDRGLVVCRVREKRTRVCPLPPYTTDTLIQDCSRILGLTSTEVMRITQDLYEAGLITYHRTDSTYVSQTGMSIAREYLKCLGLIEHFKPRAWGEPGHHETLRPTRPLSREEVLRKVALGELRLAIPLTSKHLKVYDLILRRFVASQMACQEVVEVEAELRVPGLEEYKAQVEFVAERGRGFMELYPPVVVAPELYSALKQGVVKPLKVVVTKGSKVKLFNHGDVIALMRFRGIGRPSTYARTIEVLKRHGYIIESKKFKYLIPTNLGRKVYEILISEYPDLVSEERTRKLLEKVDAVGQGTVEASELLTELLNELEALLMKTAPHATAAAGAVTVEEP